MTTLDTFVPPIAAAPVIWPLSGHERMAGEAAETLLPRLDEPSDTHRRRSGSGPRGPMTRS